VWAYANKPLTVTVYHQVTTTLAWITAPKIEICDPSKGWKAAGEALASSSSFSVADTDWHTDSVSYTPAYDRLLTIRIRGCGGDAGGTGTGKMYWWQAISPGGGGGGTVGLKQGNRL
jgi:hypothetical protein